MPYGLVVGALFALLLLVGFLSGLVWWVRRPLSSRRESSGALPLFGHDQAVVYPRADDEEEGEDDRSRLVTARSPNRDTVETGLAFGAMQAPGDDAARVAEMTSPRNARTASPSWATPSARTEYTPMPAGAAYDGLSVRYSVPTDSTLPYLPGRLEIVGGPDLGRDIRFVRMAGRDAIDVTFGRTEGPPYRHVQLHDATVSRAHACLRYRDGRWLLANLSATNPVQHNGVVMEEEAGVPLAEGDRIAMGEVVFRFHA